jgi:hypothetical protein
MTQLPDHRPGRVTLACSCGHVLELPPLAAEAAHGPWERIHSGPGHSPTDPAKARQVAESSTFEGFIAAAQRAEERG